MKHAEDDHPGMHVFATYFYALYIVCIYIYIGRVSTYHVCFYVHFFCYIIYIYIYVYNYMCIITCIYRLHAMYIVSLKTPYVPLLMP